MNKIIIAQTVSALRTAKIFKSVTFTVNSIICDDLAVSRDIVSLKNFVTFLEALHGKDKLKNVRKRIESLAVDSPLLTVNGVYKTA